MAEVEIQPKVLWRSIVTVTASAGPTPPAGTAIIELDGPHGLTDDDGVWVSDVAGISGISESSEQPITVIDPTTVSLDDATSISGTYTGGGAFRDAREYFHAQPNGFRNPISLGGALYYCLTYQPSGERVANLGETTQTRMYKSTDNGATWVRQDAAGEVLQGTENLTTAVDGTTIWVSYTGSSFFDGARSWETNLVVPFDTTTDSWGTPSPQGPLGNPPGSLSIPVVMADGRILLFHEYAELQPGSSTTDSRRPAWSVYDPVSGLWDSINNFWSFGNNSIIAASPGTPPSLQTASAHGYLTGLSITIAGVGGLTNINGNRTITVTGPDTFTIDGVTSTGAYTGGGTTYVRSDGSGAVRLNGAVLGDSGIVHVFYAVDVAEAPPDRAYLLHRSFDTATLALTGDEQVLSSNATERFNACGVPLAYERGGSKQLFLVVGYQEPSSAIEKLEQIEAVSALNPVWATSDVTVRADLPGTVEATRAAAAYDSVNDVLWLFFTYIGGLYPDGGSRFALAYKSKTPGSAWGADTVWKTDGNYSYTNAAPAVIGTDVRVVYSKLRPEEIASGVGPNTLAYLFPHIDVVSVCPPGAAANYAFFY